MAKRTKRSETLTHISFILKSGQVAEEGNIACIDTADGSLVAVSTATTLIPIGYFDQGVNLTGNGTLTARVKLFREIRCERFVNDTVNPVTAAARLANCFLKDGATVSILSTGRSVAGKVWDVDATKGVLVQMATEF